MTEQNLWGLVLNVLAVILAAVLSYVELILIDWSNGSDFKDQMKKISDGNMAVAVLESAKFFSILYLNALIMKF